MPTPEQILAIREILLQLAPSNNLDKFYTYHRGQMFYQAAHRGDINMACVYASHCEVLDVDHIRAALTLILS